MARTPTNATEFTADDDIGTDGRLRPATETQSIPPATANYVIPDPSQLPAPGSVVDAQDFDIPAKAYEFKFDAGVGANDDQGSKPTVTAGAAEPGDDSEAYQVKDVNATSSTTSNGVTTLVNKTARPITPQPNLLDQYSSYTYSISIYLMSPEDYARLITSKKRFLPGFQLLMQSGGAPQQSGLQVQDFGDGDPGGVSLTQGRNQFFPNDFYLDDLELKSVVHGKGTGGAHNVVELKFKIVEPNGITLLDQLYKAAHQYVTRGGGASRTIKNANYAAQNYLMVIRYYGYDENGNLKTTPQSINAAERTDERAILEKFIPFQFTSIKFRIANKLTEYQCEATCPQNVIATGQGRGVIPFNIELTATTLQNLFNGSQAYARPGQAPAKADSAPTPTLTAGLTQALNKYQQELKNGGTYEIADVYKIVISHPEIANSSIVPPATADLKSKPMTQATTASQAVNSDSQPVNTRAKTVSATAGMSIVQFIDLAVRSSDYIYKQQTKLLDEDGKEIPQGAGAKAFGWYRIGVEAKPIQGGTDAKRNDNAYQITYEIAPYGVNDIKSEYFPKGVFRGAQKKYNHWFTGENTSILQFEQDFNYLYYITINSTTRAQLASRGSADYREVEKRTFAPNSPQTNQGIDSWYTNEPGANAADYLYSPGDQSRVRMTIVGDPAWIEQGELWSGVRSNNLGSASSDNIYFDAFLSDGTINFDAREALFEVNFNKPADYNIETGLVGLTNKGGATVNTQVYVYKAVTVTSHFRQGKFTQDLEGVLLVFPESPAKSLAAGSSTPAPNSTTRSDENESAAETARLRRLATISGNSVTRDPEVIYTDPMGTDDAAAIMAATNVNSQRIIPPPSPVNATDASTDVGVVPNWNPGVAIDF